MLGIKLNWVSTRHLYLYILKKVEIWSDVTKAGWTVGRTTNKDRKSYSVNGPWTAEISNYSNNKKVNFLSDRISIFAGQIHFQKKHLFKMLSRKRSQICNV